MTVGGWWQLLNTGGCIAAANLLNIGPNYTVGSGGSPGGAAAIRSGIHLLWSGKSHWVSNEFCEDDQHGIPLSVRLGVWALFRESIISCKLAGLAVILLGIFLVGR